MSKLARALTLVAMLAAMHLAGLTAVAQAHTTDQPTGQADATVRRLLARERFSTPDQAPAHPRLLLDEEQSTLRNLPSGPPTQLTSPTEPTAAPNGQAGWRIPALGLLAAVLALAAGVAVLAARRAHRSHHASQTA